MFLSNTNKSSGIYRNSKNLGSAQELQRILTKSATTHLASHVIFQRELRKIYAMGVMEARRILLFNGKLNQENVS